VAQIITAKRMGGEWYFGSRDNTAYKLTRGSDGVDYEGSSSSGNPQPVDDGKYYSGKGSFWTASGIPWSGTGMTCGTNTNVGDHYWSTYVFGADKREEWGSAVDIEHSPVYDNLINRISFDWVKVDGATKDSKRHHIRAAALGLIYRTGNRSYGIKSFPCPTNEILHRFETSTTSGYTQTGSYNKTCSGAYVKYPVGFFLNIEWQGNGLGSASSGVPKIVVKNLRLGVNTTNDPILTKFQRYQNYTRPDPLPIWTK
jgi:hypothetical protein